MKLTLSTFFNASSILRQSNQQTSSGAGAADKNPKVNVHVDQHPKGSSGSSAPPPKTPKIDVNINKAPKGGVPTVAILAGLAVAAGGGYWYLNNTKKGEQAMVDAKGELEKAKISAKYAGGDALDKAKDVAHDKLDKAKDAAKDGLDKAKGVARDKLDDVKKALK